MAETKALAPASELARHGLDFPNESAEYRRARTALLAEEIELRRQIERVAEQRRALPPGGKVPEDYLFQGENGPVRFSELFGDKETLVVYNYMYGPKRERPCPMCTSLLSAYDGEMPDILQRVAFAVVAKSPIERLARLQEGARLAAPEALFVGRKQLQPRLFAEGPNGEDDAAFNVFTPSRRHHPPFLGRRDGRQDRRSRPGSARRPRPDAAVDDPRHHARRARHRLVSEARLRAERIAFSLLLAGGRARPKAEPAGRSIWRQRPDRSTVAGQAPSLPASQPRMACLRVRPQW